MATMPLDVHALAPASFTQSSRSCMSYSMPSSFISSRTLGMMLSCNVLRRDRMVTSFSLYLATRVLWVASRAWGTDIRHDSGNVGCRSGQAAGGRGERTSIGFHANVDAEALIRQISDMGEQQRCLLSMSCNHHAMLGRVVPPSVL